MWGVDCERAVHSSLAIRSHRVEVSFGEVHLILIRYSWGEDALNDKSPHTAR